MKKLFGLVFWIHLVFLVGALLSPILFDWKLIILAVVLLHLQWWILDGCYLTILEAGKDPDMTFEYYYLSKIWPTLNKKKVKFIGRYVLPILVLIVAYVIQVGLDWQPLLQF